MKAIKKTKGLEANQMLLRDFIHDRLYGKPDDGHGPGYFLKKEHQVGKLRSPIKFEECRGYYDYRQSMERLYPENAWVTPCELFKPYYSYAVANFMLSQLDLRKNRVEKPQLKITEIGPGTGTFANHTLEFFRNYDLNLYRNSEYTFVEISPQLAASCEQTMREHHKELLEQGKIKIVNKSILDLDMPPTADFRFVVGLEILDNMPHDRLYSAAH